MNLAQSQKTRKKKKVEKNRDGQLLYTPKMLPVGVKVSKIVPGFNPKSSQPKTQKMVLDATLLNTQHYKVRIKGKVEPSRERSSAVPYTLVL